MNKYIQWIKVSFKASAILMLSAWVIGYFGGCFYEWELLNSIQWVIDLPTTNQGERGAYLIAIGCVTGGSLIYVLAFYCDFDLSKLSAKKPIKESYTGYVPTKHMTTTYQASTPPPGSRPKESLDAVDIAMGVAGGIVVGDIISDIFD